MSAASAMDIVSGRSRKRVRAGTPAKSRARSLSRGQAAAVRLIVRKQLEVKHRDQAITDQPAYNGTVTNMTAIAQGVAEDERIGDKVRCTRVQGKFRIQWDSGGATLQTGRLIIFLHKNCAGNLLTGANILNGAGTERAPLSLFNVDLPGSYSVLYDSGPRTVDLYHPSAVIQFDKRLLNYTHFQGANATDEAANQVCMLRIVSTSGLQDPTWLGDYRLHYQDA